MKLPRFSIGLMAYLVLIATLDLAWVIDIFKQMSIGRSYSVFGLSQNVLDAPIFGLANVLAISGYPLLVRRAGRPFLVGFVVGGLLCSAIYIVLFRTHWNLSFDVAISLRPIDKWFGLTVYRPGDLRFVARYLAYLALRTLAGALPLVALAAMSGLLTRLVAKGKQIPRMITAAIVAVLMGSTWMTLRRIEYQEHATNCEEICQVLSSEADAIAKELEKAKSAGSPPGAQAEAEIKVMEKEIAGRKAALAKTRRQLEKYRRASNRPWLSVEE